METELSRESQVYSVFLSLSLIAVGVCFAVFLRLGIFSSTRKIYRTWPGQRDLPRSPFAAASFRTSFLCRRVFNQVVIFSSHLISFNWLYSWLWYSTCLFSQSQSMVSPLPPHPPQNLQEIIQLQPPSYCCSGAQITHSHC